MDERLTDRSATTKAGNRQQARKTTLRRARFATAGLAAVAFVGSLVGIIQGGVPAAQQAAQPQVTAATQTATVIQRNVITPLPALQLPQAPAAVAPLVLPAQPQVSLFRPRMRTRGS